MTHDKDADVNAELRDLCAKLRMEAQSHAMEVRGVNDMIQKIYQIVTGARGEPGNWNAEVPVREEFERLRDLLHDAKVQIEYLHDKFQTTGTGNTIIARINAALLPYVKREMGR